MATECIGDLNHKQPHVRIMDPYSSGVNSGRRAAPDAQSAAQNTEAHARAAAAANGMEPTLSQPWKNGCKRVGTPAPSVPPSPSPLQLYLPSLVAPPPALVPFAWYTAHATPSAQTAVHSTGTYACAAGPSTLGNSPPQSFAPHHMHGGTPAPSAPPPSSGHLAWYPMPTTYPPEMYTPTLYPAQYPIYWPNGHFHTPHVTLSLNVSLDLGSGIARVTTQQSLVYMDSDSHMIQGSQGPMTLGHETMVVS